MSQLKASDLRAGNLVYGSLNEICKVKQIGNSLNPNLVAYTELNSKSWGQNGQKPIPLTEEWVLKFGFENKNTHYQLKIANNWTFEWFDNLLGFSLCKGKKGLTLGKIQYVHQLQNLFFALTGEELEVSEG